MSNDKKVEGVDNLDIYIKNALDTNIFFMKVSVAVNIAFHILTFLAIAYLVHELMFNINQHTTTSFTKEFIFLFVTPILFKVLVVGSYKRSRNEHYNNLIKNRNEQ